MLAARHRLTDGYVIGVYRRFTMSGCCPNAESSAIIQTLLKRSNTLHYLVITQRRVFQIRAGTL